MDLDIEGQRRNVIPRWRDFRTTLALGELHVKPGDNADSQVDEGALAEQITDWQNNRTLSFAMDLVNSGFVLGNSEDVKEAADFVLSTASQATELQKKIARQAKNPTVEADLSIAREPATCTSEELISHSQKLVRKYREQLRNAPRDPVKLVELSRQYAILGSRKKAVRMMDAAVALAPANRFVLRSAARLFVHIEEADKAHHILKRAPSLRVDPWLLAAEIAVSSMLGRTSGHIRTGLSKLSNEDYSAFEVSELASAIATLEMENANSKLARKLFRQALRRPTENSIAQAVWASRLIQHLPVEVQRFDTPRKYEALAWSHYEHENWDAAINQGKGWILDQPFAISPVLFTGYVALILENFGLAAAIYDFGVRANQESKVLRNNLAFALASKDQPELAETELARIDKTSLTPEERVLITATEGLIKFRKGFPDEGRALYHRAIELAKENKEPGYAVRGLIFLAREEINSQTEAARQALEIAAREFQNQSSSGELRILLRKLTSIVKTNHSAFGGVLKATNSLKPMASKSKGTSE